MQHRYGVTVEKHIFSGDKHKRYFHLYFSPSKMAAERDRVEKKIAGMAATLKSLEGQKVELPKEYLNYFHCHFMKGKTKDEAKTFLYAEEKESVVQRELDLCGYFAIITSETMSAEQAYILCKGRDASEKLFGADKTFLGSRSMRVQSNEAVSAKFFIEFIALIIRNRFYILLKEEMLRTEKRKNFLTVPSGYSAVQAGFPSPAEQYQGESIDFNDLLITNAASTFVLKAKGESMIEAGIDEGDLLVVDRSVTEKPGDIVIMQVNNEFTVKRFMKKRGKIYLHPENSSGLYDDIFPGDGDEWVCFGVVKHVIKSIG